VSDEAQARLLSDPGSVSYLHPFWAREETVAGAAKQLGRPVNAVHYRVNKLLKAGLLQVTRAVPRHGRAIRYYRSRGDTFFIPDSLGPYPGEEERFLADIKPILERLARGLTVTTSDASTPGRCLYLDNDRRIYSSHCHVESDGVAHTSDDPRGFSRGAAQYGTILLTEQDACSFRDELKKLVNRFTRSENSESNQVTREYSFITAIARNEQ
jgi:DNA-binding Lrp family transcriptional regulator